MLNENAKCSPYGKELCKKCGAKMKRLVSMSGKPDLWTCLACHTYDTPKEYYGINCIIKGITPYKRQQQAILDAIEAHGCKLTQDEFDEVFGTYKTVLHEDGTQSRVLNCNRPLEIWPHSDDAFILGGLVGNDWAKYLNLLQLMVSAGMLMYEMIDGKIVYSKVKKPTPSH